MTKTVIMIGEGGLAAALAALQNSELPEVQTEAPMLNFEADEPSGADYGMDQVNALFDSMFAAAGADELVELPEGDEAPDFLSVMSVLPLGTLTAQFMLEEDDEDDDGMDDLRFAQALDAGMRMLDVWAMITGEPVTSDQRIAMTLLLSNDETAEAFIAAAEDMADAAS